MDSSCQRNQRGTTEEPQKNQRRIREEPEKNQGGTREEPQRNQRGTTKEPERKQVKTHVDGAAQQGSGLQGLLQDLEQVGRRLAQVVVLGDASGEVFEAFGGGAARQRFVAAVDPESRRQAEEPLVGVARCGGWTCSNRLQSPLGSGRGRGQHAKQLVKPAGPDGPG